MMILQKAYHNGRRFPQIGEGGTLVITYSIFENMIVKGNFSYDDSRNSFVST